MQDFKGWALPGLGLLAAISVGLWLVREDGGPPPRPPTSVAAATTAAVESPKTRTIRFAEPSRRSAVRSETADPDVESDPRASEPKPFVRPDLRIAAPRLALDLLDRSCVEQLSGLDADRMEWQERSDADALRQVRSGHADFAIVTGLPGQEPPVGTMELVPLGDYVIAFLRHPGVDITTLRTAQIHRMLRGRYRDWRRLGSRAGPIVCQEQNVLLTADPRQLTPSERGPVSPDGDEFVQFVASTPGAFAAIDFPTLERARTRLGMGPYLLAVDGVQPTTANFQRGFYGPGRRLWLVYEADRDARLSRLARVLTAPATLLRLAPRLQPPAQP